MFSLFKKSAPIKPPAVPEGVTLYAIGDVHGRADLLEALMQAVWADKAPGGQTIIVFLGDYIDRGPASSKVLDMLIAMRDTPGVEWRFLRGNHEQAMIDFIHEPEETGPGWVEYGGRETLEAYDIRPPAVGADPRQWRQTRDTLELRLPEVQWAFLNSLPTRYEIGDYFFVHAGARPGVALERQHDLDLMRIRGQFLNHAKAFEKVVVHGHSIVAEVHADHRRIGVDTGAYESGVLTALKLQGETRVLLQTQAEGGSICVVRRELGADS